MKNFAPDLVVSLLPANFHTRIAHLCLEFRTNMINASYIPSDMTRNSFIDKKARKEGISILCEVGLDPGLDHMAIMMTIDRVCFYLISLFINMIIAFAQNFM